MAENNKITKVVDQAQKKESDFLVLFFLLIYEVYFLSVTETKLHLIPFFIEGVDIVVQRSECTVAVQGRL